VYRRWLLAIELVDVERVGLAHPHRPGAVVDLVAARVRVHKHSESVPELHEPSDGFLELLNWHVNRKLAAFERADGAHAWVVSPYAHFFLVEVGSAQYRGDSCPKVPLNEVGVELLGTRHAGFAVFQELNMNMIARNWVSLWG
jgi:hypothetical protein